MTATSKPEKCKFPHLAARILRLDTEDKPKFVFRDFKKVVLIEEM